MSETEAVGVDLRFPSPEVVILVRDLNGKIAEARKLVEQSQRTFELTHKYSEKLELEGKNPAEEIKKAQDGATSANASLSALRAELSRVLLDERQRFEQVRSVVVTAANQQLVAPILDELRDMFTKFEALGNSIVDDFKSFSAKGSDPSGDNKLAALDTGIGAWNDLVVQLHGPGNALIPLDDSARKSVATSLVQGVRKIGDFDAVTRRITAEADAAMKKVSS
jgi:hypothetical protein